MVGEGCLLLKDQAGRFEGAIYMHGIRIVDLHVVVIKERLVSMLLTVFIHHLTMLGWVQCGLLRARKVRLGGLSEGCEMWSERCRVGGVGVRV